jgi:hypothetical protein
VLGVMVPCGLAAWVKWVSLAGYGAADLGPYAGAVRALSAFRVHSFLALVVVGPQSLVSAGGFRQSWVQCFSWRISAELWGPGLGARAVCAFPTLGIGAVFGAFRVGRIVVTAGVAWLAWHVRPWCWIGMIGLTVSRAAVWGVWLFGAVGFVVPEWECASGLGPSGGGSLADLGHLGSLGPVVLAVGFGLQRGLDGIRGPFTRYASRGWFGW